MADAVAVITAPKIGDQVSSPAREAAKKIGYERAFRAYAGEPGGYIDAVISFVSGRDIAGTGAEHNAKRIKSNSLIQDAEAAQMIMNASADTIVNKELAFGAGNLTSPWGYIAGQNGFERTDRAGASMLKIYANAATDEKNAAQTTPVELQVGGTPLKVKLTPAGAMFASHASTLQALAANPEYAMGAKVQTNQELLAAIKNCLDFNNPKIRADQKTIGQCSDVGATQAYRGIQENYQKAASFSR